MDFINDLLDKRSLYLAPPRSEKTCDRCGLHFSKVRSHDVKHGNKTEIEQKKKKPKSVI